MKMVPHCEQAKKDGESQAPGFLHLLPASQEAFARGFEVLKVIVRTEGMIK
jgi:hypothetical protein